MTVIDLTTIPPQARKLQSVPDLGSCQSCGATVKRGRGGPAPKWCPSCRADRNRLAAAARRRASTAGNLSGSGRVAGSRNSRADWQLPPEDHLAVRAARLRLAVNAASAELSEALGSDGVCNSFPKLVMAARAALEHLQAVPVGR